MALVFNKPKLCSFLKQLGFRKRNTLLAITYEAINFFCGLWPLIFAPFCLKWILGSPLYAEKITHRPKRDHASSADLNIPLSAFSALNFDVGRNTKISSHLKSNSLLIPYSFD